MKKEEGNLLIAKFMDAEFFENNILRLPGHPACLSSELIYDTSWDSLMPVVEKINTLGIDDFGEPNFIIHAEKVFVCNNDNTEYFVSYTSKDDKLINAVWLTVIEFIKFLSKTIKQNK